MSESGGSGPFSDRLLEIVAVLLLGAATVGTAWCGLQSALWNGHQDDVLASASAERVESARLFGLATQAVSYDSNVLGQYAQAVRADDEQLQEFYRNSLVRPAFEPFLDKWQKEVQAGGQPNLFTDDDYMDSVMSEYEASQALAAELDVRAADSGRIGDSYVLTTVLLAISLFFAGVTASFRYPTVRSLLLLGCISAIAFAGLRLVDLPIAEATSGILTF